MKEIKNGVTKYRNCTIHYIIEEKNGKYFAHAQIHELASDNIETVWSDEENPYPSSGEAEVGIIASAKKIIDALFENK